MNPYLTNKGAARPRMELPVAITCAAFFAATVRATVSLCAQKNFGAAVLPRFARLYSSRPFCAPSARRAIERTPSAPPKRSSAAKKKAFLPEGCTVELVEKLIAKGYLQRLRIDREANRAYLASAQAKAS